jgi:RNA polymerase primary sigma factor
MRTDAARPDRRHRRPTPSRTVLATRRNATPALEELPGATSTLTRYFAEIRELPLLTPEEEISLAGGSRFGRDESLQRLVEGNLRFVAKVAAEYRHLGMPLEDLVNEGNLGLLEAARRFDPERGTRFITYAIWWIRKSILKALAEQTSLVRLPHYQIRSAREIREAESALMRDLGRRPDREEISRRLDRSIDRVERTMRTIGQEVRSLDEPAHRTDDRPLSEAIADEALETPEEELIRRESRVWVEWAVGRLNEQERRVIAFRFGLEGSPPLTLQETGERIGVCRERVRQIETQAKQRLRRLLDAKRRPTTGPMPDRPGLEH